MTVGYSHRMQETTNSKEKTTGSKKQRPGSTVNTSTGTSYVCISQQTPPDRPANEDRDPAATTRDDPIAESPRKYLAADTPSSASSDPPSRESAGITETKDTDWEPSLIPSGMRTPPPSAVSFTVSPQSTEATVRFCKPDLPTDNAMSENVPVPSRTDAIARVSREALYHNACFLKDDDDSDVFTSGEEWEDDKSEYSTADEGHHDSQHMRLQIPNEDVIKEDETEDGTSFDMDISTRAADRFTNVTEALRPILVRQVSQDEEVRVTSDDDDRLALDDSETQDRDDPLIPMQYIYCECIKEHHRHLSRDTGTSPIQDTMPNSVPGRCDDATEPIHWSQTQSNRSVVQEAGALALEGTSSQLTRNTLENVRCKSLDGTDQLTEEEKTESENDGNLTRTEALEEKIDSWSVDQETRQEQLDEKVESKNDSERGRTELLEEKVNSWSHDRQKTRQELLDEKVESKNNSQLTRTQEEKVQNNNDHLLSTEPLEENFKSRNDSWLTREVNRNYNGTCQLTGNEPDLLEEKFDGRSHNYQLIKKGSLEKKVESRSGGRWRSMPTLPLNDPSEDTTALSVCSRKVRHPTPAPSVSPYYSRWGGRYSDPIPSANQHQMKGRRVKQALVEALALCQEELGPLAVSLAQLQDKVRKLNLPEITGMFRPVTTPICEQTRSSPSGSSLAGGNQRSGVGPSPQPRPMVTGTRLSHDDECICRYCGLQVGADAMSPVARMYILLAQPHKKSSKKAAVSMNTNTQRL